MARPRKKGLSYFPFDCDFFADERMVAIAGEFGIKGELAAVKLLCAVYSNGYFAVWTDLLLMKMVRELPGVSAELLSQIVNRLVRWGFFDKTLFDSDKILTSVDIQRRYFSITRNRLSSSFSQLPFILLNNGVFDAKTPVNDEFSTQKPLNNGVFDAKTPVNDEFSTQKPHLLKEKEKEKKAEKKEKEKEKEKSSSYEEDKKKKTNAAVVTIDAEIEQMLSDEIWLQSICMLHNATKDDIIALMPAFKTQCIADGKYSHRDIADAKQHINSWLRIQKQRQNNDTNSSRPTDKRRGSLLRPDATKNYGSGF